MSIICNDLLDISLRLADEPKSCSRNNLLSIILKILCSTSRELKEIIPITHLLCYLNFNISK